MTQRLAGKIALVTGIGAGIGRGCAWCLHGMAPRWSPQA